MFNTVQKSTFLYQSIDRNDGTTRFFCAVTRRTWLQHGWPKPNASHFKSESNVTSQNIFWIFTGHVSVHESQWRYYAFLLCCNTTDVTPARLTKAKRVALLRWVKRHDSRAQKFSGSSLRHISSRADQGLYNRTTPTFHKLVTLRLRLSCRRR
jgi:hypothetical protein